MSARSTRAALFAATLAGAALALPPGAFTSSGGGGPVALDTSHVPAENYPAVDVGRYPVLFGECEASVRSKRHGTAAEKAPVGDSGLRIDGDRGLDDGLGVLDRRVLPPGAERPRFDLRP